MLKILKFNNEDENKIFFSGCLHIFHKREFIWEARGYKSVQEHADEVLNKINETVGEDDKLFLLGDTFLNPPSVESCLQWLEKIKCRNVYVLFGNHNAGIGPLVKEAWGIKGNDGVESYPVCISDNVCVYGHYAEIQVNKKDMTLSHFPLYIWNKSHHGSYNLHSHCHGSFGPSLPNDSSARRLDVGWDVFNKPVSFAEIRGIMNAKGVAILDHHDSTTT